MKICFSDSQNENGTTYIWGWIDVCEEYAMIFPSTIYISIRGIVFKNRIETVFIMYRCIIDFEPKKLKVNYFVNI